MTGQNKRNGQAEEMAISSFIHPILSFRSLQNLFSVYTKAYLHMLSWGRQNDETVQWREFVRQTQKGKREISQGSTVSGKSPGLPVPTGTFCTVDTTVLFPQSSKRRTNVLSLCFPTWALTSLSITFQGVSLDKSTLKTFAVTFRPSAVYHWQVSHLIPIKLTNLHSLDL